MFIPRNAQTFKICRRTWCQWCCKFDEKKHMFKLRDGPVDWHCCSVEHAELWLHYRHKPKTHRLLKMLPAQRLEYLAGRSCSLSSLLRRRPRRPLTPCANLKLSS